MTSFASTERGLTTRTERVDGPPLVALRLWLRGGALFEPHPGLALVTGRMLTEGTRRRDWRRLALDAESRGMAVHSFGIGDVVGVSIDALAGDWRRAVDWLAELLLEPTFPEERLDWTVRQAAAELEALLDAPDARTQQAFLEQLYTPHPYGRPSHGDAESLAAITSDACRAFLGDARARGGCVAVAGAVDPDAVARALDDTLGDLVAIAEDGGSGNGGSEARESAAHEPPAPKGLAARRELTLDAAEQAHLAIGHLTIPRIHDDAAALRLAAVVLGAGAGLTGRIPERVREREGLAYSASLSVQAGAGFGPGRLQVMIGTAAHQVAQAERIVRDELERFLADGPATDELSSARAYLVGREPFRRETVRQRADRMAEAALYAAPLDDIEWQVARLESVTADDVVAASRRWLHPEALKVTVGLPSS
ncbi:MAG: pitrilysin family protein [Acidobacteriota bacterium]